MRPSVYSSVNTNGDETHAALHLLGNWLKKQQSEANLIPPSNSQAIGKCIIVEIRYENLSTVSPAGQSMG
ncbi:hypothetical protein EVAR_90768_1 [Eumeta japonica]|uniref:Uncharacterized protein n=1 Tax=Eumeta variegata TaxID=151549 RepID=A0A4C1YHV7_EUMVA|nr:hypothetical protein EVAR_90768_1 [Eumeta japonica]